MSAFEKVAIVWGMIGLLLIASDLARIAGALEKIVKLYEREEHQ